MNKYYGIKSPETLIVSNAAKCPPSAFDNEKDARRNKVYKNHKKTDAIRNIYNEDVAAAKIKKTKSGGTYGKNLAIRTAVAAAFLAIVFFVSAVFPNSSFLEKIKSGVTNEGEVAEELKETIADLAK